MGMLLKNILNQYWKKFVNLISNGNKWVWLMTLIIGVVLGQSFWLESKNAQDEIRDAVTGAKNSVWMFGTSFYKSVDTADTVVERVNKGVNLRFVFLRPKDEQCEQDERCKENFAKIANFFGQTSEQLNAEIIKTFGTLQQAYCKIKNEKRENTDHLEVRLVDWRPGARMYFIDPGIDITMFLVSYLYGSDSPDLPAFRYDGEIAEKYWDHAKVIWRDAERWKPKCQNARST